MANREILIVDGPSRLDLMFSVFYTEVFRLLSFKFEVHGDGLSRTGLASVFVEGGRQGNIHMEEWHLDVYFMPDGEKTKRRNMIEAKFTYSSRSRKGILISVDYKTLTGHMAPEMVELLTWE